MSIVQDDYDTLIIVMIYTIDYRGYTEGYIDDYIVVIIPMILYH